MGYRGVVETLCPISEGIAATRLYNSLRNLGYEVFAQTGLSFSYLSVFFPEILVKVGNDQPVKLLRLIFIFFR